MDYKTNKPWIKNPTQPNPNILFMKLSLFHIFTSSISTGKVEMRNTFRIEMTREEEGGYELGSSWLRDENRRNLLRGVPEPKNTEH